MEKQVKDLRVEIDGISQLVKELKSSELHEINKCYDSLIFGKAWLGKVLAELGTENPYKSGYKTKEDIEPTTDVSVTNKSLDYVNKNHIEKVDILRTLIERLIIILKELPPYMNGTRELAIARTNSYNYLCEAKFWLGFELQRIKEEK